MLRTVDALDRGNGKEQAAALSEALDMMWKKFLPDIQERVRVLQDAARASAAGVLTQEQRAGAQAAAHKLAGTLGTFGLKQGTELARQLEQMYSGSGALAADRLTKLAVDVHAIVDSRG